ncbi:hypothetical protein B0H19DRAFT_1253512 [Mycena capillaripes]|nr:hypothetical protein B0H19DRAFT_1253512 [Mycena capillaripes]
MQKSRMRLVRLLRKLSNDCWASGGGKEGQATAWFGKRGGGRGGSKGGGNSGGSSDPPAANAVFAGVFALSAMTMIPERIYIEEPLLYLPEAEPLEFVVPKADPQELEVRGTMFHFSKEPLCWEDFVKPARLPLTDIPPAQFYNGASHMPPPRRVWRPGRTAVLHGCITGTSFPDPFPPNLLNTSSQPVRSPMRSPKPTKRCPSCPCINNTAPPSQKSPNKKKHGPGHPPKKPQDVAKKSAKVAQKKSDAKQHHDPGRKVEKENQCQGNPRFRPPILRFRPPMAFGM